MSAMEAVRDELAGALRANASLLRAAMRRELEKHIELEEEQRIRFEIDPWSFRISFCATEEDLLPDDWLADALPNDWFERAGDACGEFDSLVSDALSPWIADAWRDLGGPARFSPAFSFFHGYHRRQYDLERRVWIDVLD
ncbi:MAG: hypothetical protein ACXWUG_02185 [Polyangiales bacterium]